MKLFHHLIIHRAPVGHQRSILLNPLTSPIEAGRVQEEGSTMEKNVIGFVILSIGGSG